MSDDKKDIQIRNGETMSQFSERIEFKMSELSAQVEVRVSELGKFDPLLKGIKIALPTTYASINNRI